MKIHHPKIVAVSTFVLGFLSFTIISLHEGSFWGDSSYDIPLVLVPAVMIGDCILLPLINYLLFDMSLHSLGLITLMKYRVRIIRWFIGSAIIALLFTITSHYAWAHDGYTDHISLKQGQLSFGGWWHFMFSYIQNILLFMFIPVWSIAIDEQHEEAIEKSHRIWKCVFTFSLLLPLNFICQFLYGIYGEDFVSGLIQAKFTFAVSIVSVFALFSMKAYNQRTLKTIPVRSSR